MKKQSVTELLVSKYAEMFVAYFDRIDSLTNDPFLKPSPFPQQNAGGHVYSGINSLVTSLKAQEMCYEFPVWMTVNQANSAGLSVRQGEHGTPIKYNSQWLFDIESGRKAKVTMEEYELMTPEERTRYKVMNSPKTYYVFNICQTDFEEKFPEKAESMRGMISGPAPVSMKEDFLDSVIAGDSWQCPIRVLDSFPLPQYLFGKDVIVSPPKEAFIDHSSYYSSMLYMMSMSSGHPGRGGWLSEGVQQPSGRKGPSSMDRLSAQLSSAMLGSLIGITTPMNHDNLSYTKRWASEISHDPNIIKTAISNATKALSDVSRTLGLGVKKGVDFTGVIGVMDEALKKAAEEKKTKSKSRRKKMSISLKR